MSPIGLLRLRTHQYKIHSLGEVSPEIGVVHFLVQTSHEDLIRRVQKNKASSGFRTSSFETVETTVIAVQIVGSLKPRLETLATRAYVTTESIVLGQRGKRRGGGGAVVLLSPC